MEVKELVNRNNIFIPNFVVYSPSIISYLTSLHPNQVKNLNSSKSELFVDSVCKKERVIMELGHTAKDNDNYGCEVNLRN